MTDNINTFRTLFQIDVAKYVEMKGQFSYLSWPFAVAQLRLADPSAYWEVRRFDGLPYLSTELGFFVEVAVTAVAPAQRLDEPGLFVEPDGTYRGLAGTGEIPRGQEFGREARSVPTGAPRLPGLWSLLAHADLI